MAQLRRVYLPPFVSQVLDDLRTDPLYANQNDATLLTILADRAQRPTSEVAIADVAITPPPSLPDFDLDDLCTDF
jgi:hypothetical protein